MSDEKKIIIDEDWKAQVEAEKQQLDEAVATPGDAASPAGTSTSDADAEVDWPPASFDMLVGAFVTEAMVGLGQLPNPITNQAEFHAGRARYAIDMLGVIQEKTKGNLAPGEDAGLEDLLHQLRMAFVAAKQCAAN